MDLLRFWLTALPAHLPERQLCGLCGIWYYPSHQIQISLRRAPSLIDGTFTNADYTTDTRAVTTGFTHIILEADVRQGEGWYRFKTGSAPLSPYSTNLPVPDDLTTTGHARLKPSQAVAIGSDNSPFTGSVHHCLYC